ncbi:MAG: hypothetical protein ACLP0L_31515, partial [Solirubrobacteraceae bacterium]
TLRDARKNLRSVSKTVTKDLENIQQALLTGKPGPKRAAPRGKRAAAAPTPRRATTAAKARTTRRPTTAAATTPERAETTAVSSEHTPSAAASTEPPTGSPPEG